MMKLPAMTPLAWAGRFVLLTGLLAVGAGCSSMSNSHSSANAGVTSAGALMRTAPAQTVFQPLQPAQPVRYQQLSTNLTDSPRLRVGETRPQVLPSLTPVKVLKINKQFALVQLKNGRRGFISAEAVAGDAELFSENAALKALPVLPESASYDPVTGLPIGFGDAREMITTDPLVDQAMLNDVDQIKLPESEAATESPGPEAEMVEGVLLRNPPPEPAAVTPPVDPNAPIGANPAGL